MSDIQEEQKRLYKRAEENDKEKWIDISKENKSLLKEIHNREINKLQDRINKAIEYINEMCLCSDGYANYGDDLRPEHIVNILQGDNK